MFLPLWTGVIAAKLNRGDAEGAEELAELVSGIKRKAFDDAKRLMTQRVSQKPSTELSRRLDDAEFSRREKSAESNTECLITRRERTFLLILSVLRASVVSLFKTIILTKRCCTINAYVCNAYISNKPEQSEPDLHGPIAEGIKA